MSRLLSLRVAATAIGVALFDATVLACPICFRVEESATTDGVLAAVIVLAGITVGVLAVCGTFVVRFARRDALDARRNGVEEIG